MLDDDQHDLAAVCLGAHKLGRGRLNPSPALARIAANRKSLDMTFTKIRESLHRRVIDRQQLHRPHRRSCGGWRTEAACTWFHRVRAG